MVYPYNILWEGRHELSEQASKFVYACLHIFGTSHGICALGGMWPWYDLVLVFGLVLYSHIVVYISTVIVLRPSRRV
ncbi:hypothetical protein P153DRAFT_45122 [Dothidotthia symphoricarpi CBS 119687]|uniref:Uncharacterized protein n=1 Tax=Dothidotthia symphoricarpi CBS 119687 TaxID=1392245 RepID=A0A6A6AAT2_9PLEO|nr:uncharacterized protein P153DRAFT_45122 [Dothidotthia symphoricarpi CBS 119687]KAF2127967.1 hypothetical protein P153DRAFT_45122 [Dothidotthia symphoricarpi CBS 119687]